MDEHTWLAERFEEQRPYERGGRRRADTSAGANPGGWLTTVVARPRRPSPTAPASAPW